MKAKKLISFEQTSMPHINGTEDMRPQLLNQRHHHYEDLLHTDLFSRPTHHLLRLQEPKQPFC